MKPTPHPFTLRQLQYAVAVGEERSFRRAAERCHVAQPSLSAQVAQLEEALGARLFERGPRQVLVTAAGRELLARAALLLVAADDLTQAAGRAADPFAGTLRVGILPTLSPYLLPSVAPAIRARFPALTIAWREDKTERLVEALGAGELDAALLALEADIGSLAHEVIAVDPFVLAMPPSHPLAKGEGPVTTAELRREEVLLLDDGHCFRTQALEVCTVARARETELRATSLSTLVQMVAAGVGVTLLPALAVPTEGPRAGLRVRPLATRGAHRTIALAWRPSSPLDAALREIAAVVRAAYPGGPSPEAALSRPRRATRATSPRRP